MNHGLAFALAVLAGTVFCAPARTAPRAAPTCGDDELCPTCHGSGRFDNALKNAKQAELEGKVIYCSERIARDPKGKGCAFVPCGPKCGATTKAAEANAEFATYTTAVDAWLKNNESISKTIKPRTPFVFIRTEHFDLIYGLPKVTLETRETFDLHGGAHLYAERLETAYRWFCELLAIDDAQMRVKRHQVFLFDDLKSLTIAAPLYAELNTDRAGHKVGDPSVLVTWRDKNVFGKNDPAFHKHVVHHLTHMIQGVWYLKVWLKERAGWLDEGLAHVAEMRLFKLSGNSCNTESEEVDYPDENWEPLVLRSVLANDTVTFANVMTKKAHELNHAEHMFAWSFTDFLLHRPDGPVLIQKLMKGVKEQREMREVFREATGFTTVNVDEAWKDWVKANYSLKP